MARGINQVNLMGRLTRDPELRQTSAGTEIATFSVAVDRQGKEDTTDYFDVTAWGKLAEIVGKYTQKGSQVHVAGRLQLDRWESNGEKKQKVSVVANDVVFVGAPANQEQSSGKKLGGDWDIAHPEGIKQDKIADVGDEPINLDDIPF